MREIGRMRPLNILWVRERERERERERWKGVGQVEVSAAVAAVPVHIFSKHFFKKRKRILL